MENLENSLMPYLKFYGKKAKLRKIEIAGNNYLCTAFGTNILYGETKTPFLTMGVILDTQYIYYQEYNKEVVNIICDYTQIAKDTVIEILLSFEAANSLSLPSRLLILPKKEAARWLFYRQPSD